MISENIDHYQLHLNSYQMLANKSAHCPESYSLQNTYSNLSNLYSLVKSYSPSKNSPNADYNNRLINQLKILLDNHPTLIDQDLQSAKKNNNDNYTRLKVIHDKLINLKNDLEKQVIQEHNVDSKKKAKDKSKKKILENITAKIEEVKYHISKINTILQSKNLHNISEENFSSISKVAEKLMIGDATSFNSEDKGVYKFLVEVNELKAWKNFDSQKMLNSKKNKKNGLMNGLSNDQSMEDILSLSSLSKDQVPYIFSDSKSNEMLKESVLNKDNLQFKFTNPSLSMPSSGIVSQLDESMINYSNTFEQPDTINPIKSQNKYDSTKQPVTHQSKNEDLTFLKNQIDAISAIIPVPQDSSRLFQRIFSNRSPVSTPEYYPTTMAFEVLNFETFRKFSTELLFTLFYRYEGTLIQKLAAKALKNQSWRFHTNYKLWFQRLQEPKTMTDEYEHGSYIYFDIEKWAKRNKDGFTFEYKYLEDRKL